MNPQASALNEVIRSKSEAVFSLLSGKGREIFFPKQGILSQSAEAKGKKINATIGEAVEDDGSPMRLPSVEKHFQLPPSKVFPYAPSPGKPDIRAKWKQMISEKNPGLSGREFSLPMVTSGLTHGLSMVGYMFVGEGDTLLVPDMFWENYSLIFANAYSANIEPFRLFLNGGLDIASLREKLNSGKPGKRLLLLNFPNNPAGYTPTVEEAQAIVSAVRESAEAGNTVLCVIDDAYFGLVYEQGVEKQSLFTWLSSVHERVLAVKLDGPTKEDYVWGFRTGFLTYGIKDGDKALYDALESKTAGAIRGNISNSSHAAQSALVSAWNSPGYANEKEQKYMILRRRFEAVRQVLNSHTEYRDVFEPLPFNSGYFMCIQMAKGIDAEKVRKVLLDEYDTGVISNGDLLRIAFSCVAAEKIPQLFDNIYKAASQVNG